MERIRQIAANENRLLTAMENGDTESLDQLLHDDLLFVVPTGQVITKEMDLGNFRSGDITIDTIISEDQVINLIDDTAIVSMIILLKGAYRNQPIEGRFRYLRVWKLCEGGWKVIGGSGIQV